MPLRVLIFFPHNPWPPRSGAHHRALEILAGLQVLGAATIFASSTFTSETAWTAESQRAIRDHYQCRVEVYEAALSDRRYAARVRRLYARLHRPVPVNSRVYSPPRMRRWFASLFDDSPQDAVMINYAYWDGLVNRRMRSRAISVMDTLDLITLHERMSRAVEQRLPSQPIDARKVDPGVLAETFFDELNLEATRQEYKIFDGYDHCIAIAPREAGRIGAQTHRTQVTHIPMTYPAQALQTDYRGTALFPTGPNLLNLQGYLYFAQRVLPLVQQAASEFSLTVTGAVCEAVTPQPGVNLRGFVEPLAGLYASTAFVICPLLGKTGQQVKIVEAMAYGLPVVATRAGAEGSPIEHGENGLVANNTAEFAEYVLRLWHDRPLCARLGRQAREHIATHFNSTQLAGWLAPLFHLTLAKPPAPAPMAVSNRES